LKRAHFIFSPRLGLLFYLADAPDSEQILDAVKTATPRSPIDDCLRQAQSRDKQSLPFRSLCGVEIDGLRGRIFPSIGRRPKITCPGPRIRMPIVRGFARMGKRLGKTGISPSIFLISNEDQNRQAEGRPA